MKNTIKVIDIDVLLLMFNLFPKSIKAPVLNWPNSVTSVIIIFVIAIPTAATFFGQILPK